MKSSLLIIAVALFSIKSTAQGISSENQTFEALQQGDVFFDAYYGYAIPGIVLSLVKDLDGTQNIDGNPYTIKTRVVGPIGFRTNYMVSSSFSIGLDLVYETKRAEWRSIRDEYNNATNEFNEVEYVGTYNVRRYKAMVRGSWFFVNTDRFTMNWANSVGFKAGERELVDPGQFLDFSFSGRVFPIAIRTALGARFFVTPNINIHTEVALFGGGSLIAGLSYKL